MKRLLLACAVLWCASAASADQTFWNTPYGNGWYQNYGNFGQGRLPSGQTFTTIRAGNTTFINVQPAYPSWPAYPMYRAPYQPWRQGWGW